MVIAEWLIGSMARLREAGVDAPRRDVLALLEDVLNKDRAWVVTHPEYEIPQDKLREVNRLIERRVNREPVAYIRGKAWFYGRFFEVSPDVMIPRPESESFIELLKEIGPKTVIDIGTGSGCLAVTAKLEVPLAEVIAIDNSKKALNIAKKNAKKHKALVKFLHGSLLNPFPSRSLEAAILMANLPYVPEELITSPEITKEPPEALFSGKDGLNHYRQLFKQLASLNFKKINIDCLMIESLENQHQEMIKLAKDTGYRLEKTDTLVQLFRKV
jgi:release factor glutamine methyltransferase